MRQVEKDAKMVYAAAARLGCSVNEAISVISAKRGYTRRHVQRVANIRRYFDERATTAEATQDATD